MFFLEIESVLNKTNYKFGQNNSSVLSYLNNIIDLLRDQYGLYVYKQCGNGELVLFKNNRVNCSIAPLVLYDEEKKYLELNNARLPVFAMENLGNGFYFVLEIPNDCSLEPNASHWFDIVMDLEKIINGTIPDTILISEPSPSILPREEYLSQ